MAIVKEMQAQTATVRIDDSCCKKLGRAELAARWAEVERAILQIDRKAQQKGDKPQASAD